MRRVTYDRTYRFKTLFDTESGLYIRSGILNNGKDTGTEPFMASFPHLIDVGVMGRCVHGESGLCAKAGIGCYQSGMLQREPDMRPEDFETILRECRGRCYQIALGGRGDPNQHESFEDLLRMCREYGIVPNFTTSGCGLTAPVAEICKRCCGAVAVSWYRNAYTAQAIELLLNAGVKTNVHYVLGNNSIDEAIARLRLNSFPKGINAVIFLLHKPVGQGTRENVLNVSDPRVEEFFAELDKRHAFKVGIDSCCVPGAVNFCESVMTESLDACEAGRFSCYIGPDMTALPCSFDQRRRFAVSLSDGTTIEEAWNGANFQAFRNSLRGACPDCPKRAACMGGCPLTPEITLCGNRKGASSDENSR